ncbi:hypothetical protein MTO96_004906 [Rhipicephalus appendiculatus]
MLRATFAQKPSAGTQVCGMLAWMVFVPSLMWLPRCSGYGKAAYKVSEAHNVYVALGFCYYNYRNFNSTLYLQDPCIRMTCYAKNKTVRIVSCEPPEPGCHWSHLDQRFPDCCRTECHPLPPPQTTCHYRDTVLQNGETLVMSRPCVSLYCVAGNLTIIPCASG